MLINLKHAAEITGLTTSYLRRLCRQGRIKSAKKIGYMWVVDWEEIEKIKQ